MDQDFFFERRMDRKNNPNAWHGVAMALAGIVEQGAPVIDEPKSDFERIEKRLAD